jgi:extradiol dioxygenase family protein
MKNPRFHMAFPVRDIDSTRAFYEGLLGATVGREAERWIDFDFWGHQISAHVVDDIPSSSTNAVDGQSVPVRHFGVILEMVGWRDLAERLTAAGTVFLIDPQVRFEGQVGEQATMFFLDPSGNALEFKAFKDDALVFAI